MINVRPQSWFVIKYLRGVFERVHISIFIPFNSLKMWEKALRKCTHSAHFVLSFIVGNISVGFAAQLIDHPLTFQSTFFLKLHFLFCYGVMTLLFVCFTHYSFACVWRDIDPQKWKLFGNGKGRPVYLCARSALVSILEQLERLRCTSLSLSVRQRAGYTQKSASLVGQIWRTNIGQIWNGNLQNCWEKEERMRRSALSLSNKEQPYLIFANFWTPPHYLGL